MANKTKRNRKPTARGVRTGDRAEDARRTKADTILDLPRRPSGASIAELTKATGWQPHSVRAALAGLRKKGQKVARTRTTTLPATALRRGRDHEQPIE